jgi:hypothetical protein
MTKTTMSPVLELPRLDATDLVEQAYAQIAGALWKRLSFEQKQQVIMGAALLRRSEMQGVRSLDPSEAGLRCGKRVGDRAFVVA